MLGDVNGDGYRNNYDIDAFELALEEYEDWEQEFGEPIGINLLGVGDCNNDGVLNNYDIDCIADAVCANCMECDSDGLSGSGDDNPTAPEVFAFLREYFGSKGSP
ncbi:MAG: hypothetical protein JNG88_19130 [Phycisphaerales bacterium]|nr:hypothetical protein [Phycisphaerales bacterium]